MARVGMAYDITRSSPHAQATSTGTGDPKTLTAPDNATGVFMTVLTTDARVTFDGTTPTSSNGLIVPDGGLPTFFPLGRDIIFTSTAGANSVVDVLWIE